MSTPHEASSSTSHLSYSSFSRFERILLGTTACAILEQKFFLLGLKIHRLLQLGTVLWLPSVFILDAAIFVSKAVATLVALLAIVVSSVSLMLMIQTGISFPTVAS